MHKRLLRKLLLLSVVAVCTCLPFAHAQEEAATVTGIVWRDNSPVVGGKVVIMVSVTSSYEGMELTDEKGYFSVSGVPIAEVHVLVYDEKDQFIGEGFGILNHDGETISVDIEMVR